MGDEEKGQEFQPPGVGESQNTGMQADGSYVASLHLRFRVPDAVALRSEHLSDPWAATTLPVAPVLSVDQAVVWEIAKALAGFRLPLFEVEQVEIRCGPGMTGFAAGN